MKPKNKKKTNRKPMQVALSCPFNGNPDLIDYKDVFKLKKFLTTRGRLLPPSKTGVSAKCQRKLALAIKRARFLAMMPYVNYV
jgi:small subunit ribosomal protein S18